MSPKQKEQFNQMRDTLIKISRQYYTPSQIYNATEKKRLCLAPEEYLEMAYENIQIDAANAVRGVREIKP